MLIQIKDIMKLKYISVYRVVAMFCIIACHIAQAYSSDMAWVLNVRTKKLWEGECTTFL